jgi:hypothetical protein
MINSKFQFEVKKNKDIPISKSYASLKLELIGKTFCHKFH